MQYLITFLEGIITFISPCVLPMIPLYILYFAGDGATPGDRHRALPNAIGFVMGFTLLFTLLGVFAGTVGGFFIRYQQIVNLVTGGIVILFGLHYTGWLKLKALNRTIKPKAALRPNRFFSAVVFGVVFAVGWSPCTGAFLGSAMMLAANQQNWVTGFFLLLCYALGMGIPFILCAVLIERLRGAFAWIKRHYTMINLICGILLILMGILMMTGLFSRFSAMLA